MYEITDALLFRVSSADVIMLLAAVLDVCLFFCRRLKLDIIGPHSHLFILLSRSLTTV